MIDATALQSAHRLITEAAEMNLTLSHSFDAARGELTLNRKETSNTVEMTLLPQREGQTILGLYHHRTHQGITQLAVCECVGDIGGDALLHATARILTDHLGTFDAKALRKDLTRINELAARPLCPATELF